MFWPIHIAAFYRFVPIEDCEALQEKLLTCCKDLQIKGTILLGLEGINATIAGAASAIDNFFDLVRQDHRFADLTYKESYAETPPFARLKVKIKKEIVTLGAGEIAVSELAGTYIPANEWADFIRQPDVLTIDTRNDYEVALGTFAGAINPETHSFRDFPEWAKNWIQDKNPKEIKVAMFCTGGIRCEKSTAFMRSLGVKQVFHLQGGILKYLEETQNRDQAWQGKCFVFDDRVTVDDQLNASGSICCEKCNKPITRALKPYEAFDHNDEELCVCFRD